MLKKTITFTDFNGISRTEDFYFHLSKAEIIEMELRSNGTLTDTLTAIGRSNDGRKIIDKFKEIIGQAYGVKSEDGRRFIKSPELAEEFFQSGAWEELFLSFVLDSSTAAEFIKGLVPAELQDVAQQMQHVGRPERPGRQPMDYQRKKPTTPNVPTPVGHNPAPTVQEVIQDAAEQGAFELEGVQDTGPEIQAVHPPVLEPAQDEEYQQWLREKAARQAQELELPEGLVRRPQHESGPRDSGEYFEGQH